MAESWPIDGETFGSLLRGYRATANLSQEELAERSGLSVHAIGMLERGVRRRPRTGTVEALAAALELDASQRGALIAAARRPAPVAEPAPTSEGPVPLAAAQPAPTTAPGGAAKPPQLNIAGWSQPDGSMTQLLARYTERWHGVYTLHPERELVTETVDGRIHLLTAIGGKGMTTGPAVARASIDRIG